MEMNPTPHQDMTGLQQAFETFNEVSGQLQASYDGLQQRAVQLQAELNIANQERAEEAQRNHELANQLTTLLEALPGAVIMLDENGRVKQINSVASHFLGEPLQDLEWTMVSSRAFENHSGDLNGDLTLRDGRRISLAQKAMEPGPGRVLLLTDVSEHRKIQELLARHQRLAAMGEMAAALAHQIRTPLSAALLYTSNASHTELNAEQRQAMLDNATSCLHDLEQLISDMLQFARGANQSESRFDLSDLLDTLTTSLAPIKKAGQQLDIEKVTTSTRLTGNKEALAGAILNLATNAFQAAGSQARVEITTAITPLQIEIQVSDNGPGVTPEIRDKIFKPFFTSRSDGTGLGLAVAQSVVRAHGGEIVLKDNPSGGAQFIVRLPVSNCIKTDLKATALVTTLAKDEAA